MLHKMLLYSQSVTVVAVCSFIQNEVSGTVESSAAVNIQIVEVTGGGLKPVVRLEKLDLSR